MFRGKYYYYYAVRKSGCRRIRYIHGKNDFKYLLICSPELGYQKVLTEVYIQFLAAGAKIAIDSIVDYNAGSGWSQQMTIIKH